MNQVSMQPGPIVLSSNDDWPIWLNQISVFAKSRGVWEYVHPQSSTPKSAIQPPAPRCTDIRSTARSLRDLNHDELSRWLLLSADHDMAMKRYEKIRASLGEVHMEIIHTVAKEHQWLLVGQETPRDCIRRLAHKLPAPSTPFFCSPWKEMLLNPPVDDLDRWIGTWHSLYKQGKDLGIWDMEVWNPGLDFLGVVEKIAPDFAGQWNSDKSMRICDLPLLLEDFRHWMELSPNPIIRRNGIGDNDKCATSQTPNHSNRSTTETQVSKSGTSGPAKDCLCGKRHFFSDCPYVVEALRPANWKCDPEVFAKFEEKSQSDTKFYQAIQRAARNGNSKHGRTSLERRKFRT